MNPACGTIVEGNVVSYACDLLVGHEGPHRAVENVKSVRAREVWEKEQEVLAQSVPRAQTTAERYTTGALPHPDAAPPEVEPDPDPEPDPEVEPEPESVAEDLPVSDVVYEEDPLSGTGSFTAAVPEERRLRRTRSEDFLPRSKQLESIKSKLDQLVEKGDMTPEEAEGMFSVASRKAGMETINIEVPRSESLQSELSASLTSLLALAMNTTASARERIEKRLRKAFHEEATSGRSLTVDRLVEVAVEVIFDGG